MKLAKIKWLTTNRWFFLHWHLEGPSGLSLESNLTSPEIPQLHIDPKKIIMCASEVSVASGPSLQGLKRLHRRTWTRALVSRFICKPYPVNIITGTSHWCDSGNHLLCKALRFSTQIACWPHLQPAICDCYSVSPRGANSLLLPCTIYTIPLWSTLCGSACAASP